MSQTLASVNVRIGAQIDDLQKGLKQAERALLKSGREMQRIGGDLTRNISLPIAAAGAASLKFASDFEESFLKINTLVGVSGNTLQSFRDGIANLSGPLGQSQAALSDALFVITSAGQRGSEALDTLEAASKASSIGLGNTADIARAAVAAVQAYGSANLSSADAVDKLTAIVRAGNLEASELAPALGRVLPIASQLGVSFDEVGANIATFTRLGVSASESVTALRSLLSNLLKPSKEAADELARLGLSADDLRNSVAENGLAATLQQLITVYDGNTEGLAKLFGNVEGLANALGTAGAQGEDYLKIVNEIANSNGIVNEGFEKVAETANFKMKRALVELQNVGVQFGGALIPVVTDLLGAVTPLVSAFTKLSPELQRVIVSSAVLAASAGPVISVYGNLQSLIGGVGIAYRQLSGLTRIYIANAAEARAAALASGQSFSILGAFVSKAATAWKGFNTVTKVSTIGLAVTAVAALAAAVAALSESLGSATDAQKSLNAVNATAAENIVAERVAAQQLINVLQDETAAKEDKEAALRRLNEISPTYFNGLNIEKSSVEQINRAYDAYVDNLLRAARAQAAQAKIVELEKERLAILEKVNQSPSLSDQLGLIFSGQRTFTQLFDKQIQDIEDKQKSLASLAGSAAIENSKLQNIAATVAGGPLNINTQNGGSGVAAAPSFAGFGNSFTVINDAVNSSSLGIQRLNNDFRLLSANTNIVAISNDLVKDSFLRLREELENDEALRNFSNQVNGIVESGVENTLVGIGEALAGVFSGTATAGNVLGAVLEPILGMMEQLGKLAIGTGIAIGGIRKALQTLNPVAAIAAGVGLVALSKIVRGQLASLKPKAFATGGIVREPTLALIGEYPGAASNPEYILRQDQLQGIADRLGGGGNGADYLPAFALDGDTLMVWYERAAAKRSRRTG